MSILEAFVICFIAGLLYKIMKPSGVPSTVMEKLKADFMKASATLFKESNIKNKTKVADYHADLRSGDPIRVEEAIQRIDAIFDAEILASESTIAQYSDKAESTITNSKS
jgi:hypothetical protein